MHKTCQVMIIQIEDKPGHARLIEKNLLGYCYRLPL